ncbi:hypothetical protein PV371_25115 [Streptomyces sp. TX20-6-3]|uniref:hypothetical protein n=1 Tax=Streptomyces sp. TX20-6-3 TaxID=3028705 RepID=UPI0029A6C14F|nr:hypothetical protein [Streptomyces sp. TX20-6-3]MDX2562914.1 hypothetical protein [Streptomyces sp. TX20-6-3]
MTVGEARTTLSGIDEGSEDAAPAVHVHIERIEVVRHEPAPPTTPARRPLPRVDLDAYLTRRREDR